MSDRGAARKMANLIGLLYEAAMDRQDWGGWLSELRRMFGASRAYLAHADPRLTGVIADSDSPQVDGDRIRQICAAHPLTRALKTMAPGGVVLHRELPGWQDFRASRWWQEWYAPGNLHDGLSSLLLRDKEECWVVTLYRGEEAGAFQDTHRALFEQIVPHLLRVAEITSHFQRAMARTSTFSHLSHGAILVDDDLRMLTVNEAAERILRRPDMPLLSRGGRLLAGDPRVNASLQRLLVDVCQPTERGPRSAGGDLMLRGGEASGVDLMLSVTPFVRLRIFGLPRGHSALVRVRELMLGLPAGFEGHLRDVFGLTAAEARLAVSLAGGQSLKSAAIASLIRFSTARSYLDSIFRKTNTHQQSQLVALIKSAQPFVRHGSLFDEA